MLQPCDLIFTGAPEGMGLVVVGIALRAGWKGVGSIVSNVGPEE